MVLTRNRSVTVTIRAEQQLLSACPNGKTLGALNALRLTLPVLLTRYRGVSIRRNPEGIIRHRHRILFVSLHLRIHLHPRVNEQLPTGDLRYPKVAPQSRSRRPIRNQIGAIRRSIPHQKQLLTALGVLDNYLVARRRGTDPPYRVHPERKQSSERRRYHRLKARESGVDINRNYV